MTAAAPRVRQRGGGHFGFAQPAPVRPGSALDKPAARSDNPSVAAVVIEHLTKIFRGPRGEAIRALDDFSLAVASGELLTLVGPSGCGKTTLLRLIAGLEHPDAGTIALDGRVANATPPRDREVALVFQNGALYPHLTARQNLAFPLKVRRVPRAEADQRVRETAELLGLVDCLPRRPAELSGGERQRVALGRALVRRPRLLLLDEPLSNLDAPLRAELRGELRRLHARLGATFIHVSHDQDEALALGQRVAVMRAGALQQVDRPSAVYRRPANLFVATFIGSPPMNLLRGRLVRETDGLCFHSAATDAVRAPAALVLRLAEAPTASANGWTGREVVLGLRPEDISLPAADRPASSRWPVEARVEGVEPAGYETRVQLALGGTSWIASVRCAEAPALGQQTTVELDLRNACFFDAANGQALR